MLDREQNNKEIYFARRVLDSLNMVSEPKLVYEEEKRVVEKALRKYISDLEYKEYFDRWTMLEGSTINDLR